MKKWLKIVSIGIAILLIAYLALYLSGKIGVAKGSVWKEAHSSQKVDDFWDMHMEISDSMAAMIFFSDSLDDYIYSIYVNRPGLSFGYFFRPGGSNIGIEDSIAEFQINGYDERCFISMNKKQAVRAEFYDGNGTTWTLYIDSTKPFVYVLPDTYNIVFYDGNGVPVESVLLIE